MHEGEILICIDACNDKYLQIGMIKSIDFISGSNQQSVTIEYSDGDLLTYGRNEIAGCFKKILCEYVC